MIRQATYNIDVEEVAGPVGSKQSKGRFRVRCRETGTELIGINAEFDISRALTIAGWPDGPVQFWRGSVPSLSHGSVHRMGRWRIALGEKFPQRVRREDGADFSSETLRGSSQEPLERIPVGSEVRS